ncbi:MAG: ORC1-type DNA replication protein [Candidatus Methanomethylicaceae archaeon]
MSRIFINEEKLSLEYVPPKLPFREKELEMLNAFFSSFIKKEKCISPRVIITGSTGTGKTALCKLFGREAEKEAEKHNIKIKFIYLNCKTHRTLFSILKEIIENLKIPSPTRGLSNEDLFNAIINYIYDKKIRLILALDEIDFLIKEENSEAIYFLTRIGEEKSRGTIVKISLICILRNPEDLSNLDESSRSSLQSNFIHLEEYDKEQFFEIIKYRAKEAFYENVISEEIMKFIAEISSERGDAKYAIELLWRAGKFAEIENSDKIMPEHVRKASASIYPTNRDNIMYLDIHKKLILLALSRSLKENEEIYVPSSELNKYYRIVCEEHHVEPKSYTRFWEDLQKLEDLGFIRIKVLSEGKKGRRMYIFLPGIPASILENELSKIIKFRKWIY